MERQQLLGIADPVAERGDVAFPRFRAGLLVRSARQEPRTGVVEELRRCAEASERAGQRAAGARENRGEIADLQAVQASELGEPARRDMAVPLHLAGDERLYVRMRRRSKGPVPRWVANAPPPPPPLPVARDRETASREMSSLACTETLRSRRGRRRRGVERRATLSFGDRDCLATESSTLQLAVAIASQPSAERP